MINSNSTNNQSVATSGSGWYFDAFPTAKHGNLLLIGVG
jgi:hypothetical protein